MRFFHLFGNRRMTGCILLVNRHCTITPNDYFRAVNLSTYFMKIRLLFLLTFSFSAIHFTHAQDAGKASTLAPAQDAEMYNNSGTTKFNAKQYADALLDFNKAIELKPDFEKAYYNRGLAKNELLMNQSAVADFTKSIELNPAADYSYYSRGVAK